MARESLEGRFRSLQRLNFVLGMSSRQALLSARQTEAIGLIVKKYTGVLVHIAQMWRGARAIFVRFNAVVSLLARHAARVKAATLLG